VLIQVKSTIAGDAVTQLDFFFQMLTGAIAIVTGLFTANVIIKPLRCI